MLRSYLATGFGYSDYAPGRAPVYGVSLTSPAWIRATLERVGGFREVAFAEKAWADHHDIYGVVPSKETP